MDKEKEKIKDIVPDIKMNDMLSGNFFVKSYPLEDSGFDEIAMHRKDDN